jgi:sulfate permease, SulP family
MSFLETIKQKIDFEPFIPKSIICFREGYSKKLFLNDMWAGISVGVISLPLAMAFAIGAGVGPERGLFTAIIAGFLISLLGGSRVQIAGPTGAFIVLIYNIIQRQGYEGLAIATLIAGCILIVLGITKCGTYIRFIPYPVTTGFTTGIAISLFFSQLKDFFGLQIPEPSVDFIDRLQDLWVYQNTINPWANFLALLALTIIVGLRQISKNLPGVIIAVIFTTLLAYLFDLPVDTIEKKFGDIPSMLPHPHVPAFTFKQIKHVFGDGIAIALLGAIESLLACVVADGMTGYRHKSNIELVAQGCGNIGAILFGGIPATGAVARTSANVQIGARTPVSGMVHAATLLILMILFAPFVGKIPLATLAATLVTVAFNMAEFEHFKNILKGPKSEALVLLTTFCLTVFIDLTVAVQAGVLIAAFAFLKNMSEKTSVKLVAMLEKEEKSEEASEGRLKGVPGVEVFEIEGPFFFGVSDLLNEALRMVSSKPKVFIARMRRVPLVDASGMQAIKQFSIKCKKLGIVFYICEARHDAMNLFATTGALEVIGKDHFFHTLDEAIASAKEILPQREKSELKADKIS